MTEGVSQDVLNELFAELKSWASDMAPFRYEAFAIRLVAAEYGRSDAVEWALSWYNDLMAGKRQAEAERQRVAAENKARSDVAKAEFKAGRCSNPNYQAFLDTVESPELIRDNSPYFAWMSGLLGAFEAVPGLKELSKIERENIWKKMVLEKRSANLAPRLKKPLTS